MFKKTSNDYSVFQDVKSGVVVFLVALPLCLGIALAQDAPPFSGIISGIIGGIVVTIFSGSRLSVSGPAAGLTAIVAAGIATMGRFDHFLVALCLAGIIQILFGLLKTGIVSHYFPSSVIKGMLAAIGIILIFKQLPHLAGDDSDPEGDFFFFQEDGRNTFTEMYQMIVNADPGPLSIGLISIILMFGLSSARIKKFKLFQYMPVQLLVVILGIVMSKLYFLYYPEWAVLPEHMVPLPDIRSLDDFQRSLQSPEWSVIFDRDVWILALTLATVASIETLLSLNAIDKLDPEKQVSPPNKELIAQGVGNFFCGMVGGIPITSVIVRSSANVNSGARTKLSAILHGTLLFMSVLFIPDILTMIPLASLAAVLFYTGYKLSTIGLFRSVYRSGLEQFLPFMTTILVMLMTDILKGIAAGMVVAVFFILKNNLKRPYKISSAMIDGRRYTLITLAEDVTFLNKASFHTALDNIPENSKVIIDGSANKTIDLDVIEMVDDFSDVAKDKNIEIELIEIHKKD